MGLRSSHPGEAPRRDRRGRTRPIPTHPWKTSIMKLTKTLPALAALALAGLMTTSAHALPFNYTVAATLNGPPPPAGTPNVVNLGGGNTLTLISDAALNNNVPTD